MKSIESRYVFDPRGHHLWYDNEGFPHREDGPAHIDPDGDEDWFLHGVYITDQVIEWMECLGLPRWQDWTEKEKLFFQMKFVWLR